MNDKAAKNTKETALEHRAEESGKLFSPSTARNRDFIRDAFLASMPNSGKVLEIGGGTGEHAIHLASALPKIKWFTGDPDAAARASITAWIAEAALPNLVGPHAINVIADDWDIEQEAPFDGLVSMNMIHIAPFAAAEGLFAGAGRLLGTEGKLFLYGPFARDGVHSAPSNEAFDANLKSRDPAWGVRDLEREVTPLADKNRLTLDNIVEMPANNLVVVFRKS